MVAGELPEDGQGAGQLVDGAGSQDREAGVEVAFSVRRNSGARTAASLSLTGGWAAFLATVVGRERDHPGFEQEPAKPGAIYVGPGALVRSAEETHRSQQQAC